LTTSEPDELALLMLGALRYADAFVAVAEARASDPSPTDDAWLAAALGIVSFRRSLRRWRDAAAYEAAPAREPAAASPPDAVSLR
jgi:hypothetical protein